MDLVVDSGSLEKNFLLAKTKDSCMTANVKNTDVL